MFYQMTKVGRLSEVVYVLSTIAQVKEEATIMIVWGWCSPCFMSVWLLEWTSPCSSLADVGFHVLLVGSRDDRLGTIRKYSRGKNLMAQ